MLSSNQVNRCGYGWMTLNRLSAVNPLTGINWLALKRAYQTFLKNPSQGILYILAAGEHSNWENWVLARLRRQAVGLEQATIHIDIAQLSQLPADTLGGAYARHIIQQGFNPEAFVRDDRTQSCFDYRLAISHDVYHVITGFDGSPIGEFGLAAFVLVQYRDLLNSFVLSFFPGYLLSNLSKAPQFLRALVKGFTMGMHCQPIVAYPFENHWDQPLEEVQQSLGLGNTPTV